MDRNDLREIAGLMCDLGKTACVEAFDRARNASMETLTMVALLVAGGLYMARPQPVAFYVPPPLSSSRQSPSIVQPFMRAGTGEYEEDDICKTTDAETRQKAGMYVMCAGDRYPVPALNMDGGTAAD